MASLTRKFLASIGIEEDKIDLIVEKHNEVLTEIKDERDKLKEDVAKMPDMEKELKTLKEQVAGIDPYKDKFEALQKEYDDFKADVESKQTTAKKESAFRHILKDIGIPDKRIDSVLKVSDINGIELTEDGIKDEETLKESLKKEWSDFIAVKTTEGVPSANPPTSTGKTTMTKEQIRAIPDTAARQKAMLENPTLFGLPDNSNS
jgi:uncharacterized protein YhaN